MPKRFLFVLMLFLAPAAQAATAHPATDSGGHPLGASSGLPLPRFVTLKPSEVNVRTGPGARYPIQWVYHREGMPVEIVDEFDVWRQIRDVDGTTGWVHKTMLDGRRGVVVTGKGPHILRIDSDAKTKPLLKVEPKVIGKLMECQRDWCRVQISGHKGWMEKKYLWGVSPDEVFD